NWRITFLNGSAWKQVPEGCHPIGAKLLEAFLDATDVEMTKQLQEAMSEQRPASFEVHCARQDIWYAINVFPSSEGLVIYFRDITEHKRALEARRLTEE